MIRAGPAEEGERTMKIPMQFPYGAVYFRKSNPPREDWERDYRQAAEDGLNVFRHWFMWGAIEVAPGVYDWEDYDRQLELAEKYGIKTVIAEISNCIPEWAAARYPELLTVDAQGARRYPEMGVSCATGGFYRGLCTDKPQAKEMVQSFLEKLAERYRGHPALLGYDVVNEVNRGEFCYCDDSVAAYRQWLEKKYGNIRALCQAWKRYSYTSFEEVRPPYRLGYYPDSVDWMNFNREHFQEHITWVADVLHAKDPDSMIAAHGIGSSITYREKGCVDDWKTAERMDVYGLTWVPCRHGNEPWKMLSAIDQTRSASRGKPFWHAEMQGGPLWLQPQVKGLDPYNGRVADAGDVRIWNLMSMACGTRGILNPRYRPLLDGQLFGAFGAYGMDGSRTDRSNMASSIAKWANAPENAPLLAARPVPEEVGILQIPESSMASFLHTCHQNENLYPDMMMGAYQAFLDNHIQANFVRLDQIGQVKVLYLPHPIAMTREEVSTLTAWVEKGGVLISESCPAYWNEELHVDPHQPGYGADRLFGVREKSVFFMPDIDRGREMTVLDLPLRAEGYFQTYDVLDAQAVGFCGGETIAAAHELGKGKTLLIGANPSGSYGRLHDPETRAFFRELLRFSGVAPAVCCPDERLILRLQESEDHRYLWALNPTREPIQAGIRVRDAAALGRAFWGRAEYRDGVIETQLDPLDGLVVELLPGKK